ncbi:hypothetical protein DBR47_07415 [Paucibacter sp. KBW04]|nr:hypothetical protein DBR47_07415 [Paucibacter sp. KBW04]
MAFMRAVEFWYWMMKNSRGVRRKSPCRFMAEDAFLADPEATRIPGTCEVRTLPETPEEFGELHTSAFFKT